MSDLVWGWKVNRMLSGGMVTASPGQLLHDSQFTNLNNFIYYDRLWRKRPGIYPLYGTLVGPLVGLFRLYRSDGKKYSVALDLKDATVAARLLAKENDTISSVDWAEVAAAITQYSVGDTPRFFTGANMGERLFLTDGVDPVKYFGGKDSSGNWITGKLGAFAPHTAPVINSSPAIPDGSFEGISWGDGPIERSGYFRYCVRFAYEDAFHRVAFSNSSPRSKVIPADWFVPRKQPGGRLPTFDRDFAEDDPSAMDVGPSAVSLAGISVGREFKTSATDIAPLRRIIRRELFRQWKPFADVKFGEWRKVADLPLNLGDGTESLKDDNPEPILTSLSVDNMTPPRCKYLATHKEMLWGFFIQKSDPTYPFNPGDTSYPYYQELPFLKRARVTIKNNTGHGFTDAVVRIRLQWDAGHTTDADYIDFDDTQANAERRIVFTDDDAVTMLPFYRETYDAASNYSVFVIRVPELLARASATIYVYYNTSTGVSDYSSTTPADEVYHRVYPSEDMMYVNNFDSDYPIHSDTLQEGTTCAARLPTDSSMLAVGIGNCGLAATPVNPSGNNAALLPSVGGSYQISSADAWLNLNLSVVPTPTQLGQLARMMNGSDEGCIQFWMKPSGGNNFATTSFRILMGGGIELGWEHFSGRLYFWIFPNDIAPPHYSSLVDGGYFFVSVGWDGSDSSNIHIYVRKVGEAVEDMAFTQDIALNNTPEHNLELPYLLLGVPSPIGFYDEFVIRRYCPTVEEVEQHFLRQDLSSYFYDAVHTPARGGAGWNVEGATCSISVKDSTTLASIEWQQAGLARSERSNADVWKPQNRRSVGDDSDMATGLAEVGGHLLAFKRHSIHRVRTDGHPSQWGLEDAVTGKTRNIGLVAPKSLQVGVFRGVDVGIGLSEDGVYATPGIGDPIELSAPIRDVIRSLSVTEKANCTGLYVKSQGIYYLGIAKGTPATGGGAPSAFDNWGWGKGAAGRIPDRAYAFHLDDLDPTGQVRISMLSSLQSGAGSFESSPAFNMGIGLVWNGADDGGEIIFSHPDKAYAYVMGQRTGVDKYKDNWTGIDLVVPTVFQTKKYASNKSFYRGFIPFYRAWHNGSEVRNVLDLSIITYDEVLAAEVTHPTYADVISGGLRGLPYLLPQTARGDYITFKGVNTDSDGDFILDGINFEQADEPMI